MTDFLSLAYTKRVNAPGAMAYGNMDEPIYRRMRLDEKTVAIVGGQDTGANRAIRTRTGVDYSAANDIEMFVDGRSNDTNAKLDARGDTALDKAAARNEVSYKVLQTPSTAYASTIFGRSGEGAL